MLGECVFNMRKLFLMLVFVVILLSGCQNEVKEINSTDDLKNARIGVWANSAYELRAREVLSARERERV